MVEFQPKVYLSDNNFGYNTKMEGYVTFISEMNELHAIEKEGLSREENK